jgi:hypothetical protein
MVRRLKYEYHDASVTGISIGPRREITLTAELDHCVSGHDAVINLRFGGIANFAQVEDFFRGVIADLGESYVGRIDGLGYDESVASSSRDIVLRVDLDLYGTVQIHCQSVTETEVKADSE